MTEAKTGAVPQTCTITQAKMIDITGEICPMTFVRTRLALDRLSSGALLLVRLRGAEARHSVPTNAILLGHEVVSLTESADGVTEVLLRKR